LDLTNWYSKEVEEIVQELQTNLDQGLSTDEANKRIQEYGSNSLQEPPPRRLISMFIAQLKEILVLILIIAAITSAALGEWVDTTIILIIVVLNATLGVFQENKAEQALKALKEMTKTLVKVLRAGKVSQINVDNLVPGDVILLEAGDSIPADARLIAAASLNVNEAALTGESVPVEKILSVIKANDVSIGDRKNMVFRGTSVTGGRARAIITNTGMNTELGKIARMIQETPPDSTPLQLQLAKLGRVLGLAAGVIVAVIFATGLLRGQELLDIFLTSIALAVAAIPEGLPSVVTIVLALGVTRMSRRNAIIRRLPAVETLGVATYICSDKTGTLTKNEMTVTQLYVNSNLLQVTGIGYQPVGDFLNHNGTKIAPLDDKNRELILLGGLLNSDARLETTDKGYGIIGDPTEGALVVAASKAGLVKETVEKNYPRLAEIPFDSARKMMTTFHSMGEETYSFTKGAPDVLLARCTEILTGEGLKTLNQDIRNEVLGVNSSIASQGQRVLALAFRKWNRLPQKLTTETVEVELTFIGFFAMQDPAREEVKDAVAISRSAGIKTVMITGDYQETALAIAKELDIWRAKDGVLTGQQLEKMDEEELKQHVLTTTVYARVSPEHKLRIVGALKAHGHVVAMTGDGVNDAPALKRADIGASMGITGTAVAKEASDMVLLDDNFATIVSAVKEGRAIYNNIRKSIQYLLSCNTGEIIAIFTSILLGFGSPLTPVQILWLNLVTDGPPALTLGLEPPEKGIMNQPPRNSKASVFSQGTGGAILYQGLIIGMVSFGAYWIALNWGRTLEEARTMAFLTMAFSQLIHAFNVRSFKQSLFTIGIGTNRPLVYAFLVSAGLQLAVVNVPFLREIFKTALLRGTDLLVVLLLCLTPLAIEEIVKFFRRRSN